MRGSCGVSNDGADTSEWSLSAFVELLHHSLAEYIEHMFVILFSQLEHPMKGTGKILSQSVDTVENAVFTLVKPVENPATVIAVPSCLWYSLPLARGCGQLLAQA